jgi:hypothetical protein
MLLPAAALEPLLVLDAALPPAGALDDAAPPAGALAAAPALPPFVIPPPAPGAVVDGFAAPISPAVVPGPARPALSVSAGEPAAAYAPATAADMQPATNANMSFLISTSRKKVIPRLFRGRGQQGISNGYAQRMTPRVTSERAVSVSW